MYNTQIIFKPILISLLLLGLLTACGGGRQVVTQDDSADYESAKSLPPLKKPSAPTAVASASTPNEESSTPADDEPTPLIVEPTAPEPADDVRPSATVSDRVSQSSPDTTSQRSVSARVIGGDADNSRLEIAAEFDSAWIYLSKNLKRSDVTVFSRNKAAGRFSIGCGAMESAPTVIKRGGWSIFNRAKQQRTEYCALSVVERRDKTLVFVLNRDGTEVSNEYSQPLFSRILNN